MTVWRLIGIIFIFFCTSVAWAILGTSITARTNSGYALLNRQVEDLWGSEHYQKAPTITLKTIEKDGDKEKKSLFRRAGIQQCQRRSQRNIAVKGCSGIPRMMLISTLSTHSRIHSIRAPKER
jgi:hypothetical protein